MKRLILSVTALALLAGFALWWLQPAQALKRRTQKLLHTLTLSADSKRSGRQLGIYGLHAMLATSVELDTTTPLQEVSGNYERSEVESAFSWLCEKALLTRFEVLDFHSVTIQGDQADVAFALDALVELPESRPADGRYEVEFHWLRENDNWHLSRAKWVDGAR